MSGNWLSYSRKTSGFSFQEALKLGLHCGTSLTSSTNGTDGDDLHLMTERMLIGYEGLESATFLLLTSHRNELPIAVSC